MNSNERLMALVSKYDSQMENSIIKMEKSLSINNRDFITHADLEIMDGALSNWNDANSKKKAIIEMMKYVKNIEN